MAQLRGPWSPTPFTLDPVLAAAVDRTCRADMDPFPAGIPLLAFDARGEGFTQVYYADQMGSIAICNGIAINANGPPTGQGGGSTGEGIRPMVPLTPFELRQLDGGSEGLPAKRSFVGGLAGPDIAHVLILLPGQQPIVTSYSNHWFGAWIPGAWPAGWRIAGFDASGRKVAEVAGA